MIRVRSVYAQQYPCPPVLNFSVPLSRISAYWSLKGISTMGVFVWFHGSARALSETKALGYTDN